MNLKTTLCVALACLATACVSPNGVAGENRANLERLRIGMSRQAVMDVMGHNEVTLYSLAIPRGSISNPHRIESFKTEAGDTIDVLYYYTEVKRRDGACTDDELTPIVLKNDALVGWGRTFFDNTKQIELRIR